MFNLSILRHIAYALCVCFFVISCGKKADQPTDFKISGVNNIMLEENGSSVLDLNVELLTSNAEQVTLSIENIPEGISPNFNRTTDKPPFSTSLYIKDDSSKGGEYIVTLIGTSAKGVVHTYNFTITTLNKTCAIKASGLYYGTSTCRDGNGLVFNNIYFLTDSTDKDKLFFTWQGKSLYGEINCNRNKFTIPLQSVGDHTIKGDGKLDKNYTTIDFAYTARYNNGDTITCNAFFYKK